MEPHQEGRVVDDLGAVQVTTKSTENQVLVDTELFEAVNEK